MFLERQGAEVPQHGLIGQFQHPVQLSNCRVGAAEPNEPSRESLLELREYPVQTFVKAARLGLDRDIKILTRGPSGTPQSRLAGSAATNGADCGCPWHATLKSKRTTNSCAGISSRSMCWAYSPYQQLRVEIVGTDHPVPTRAPIRPSSRSLAETPLRLPSAYRCGPGPFPSHRHERRRRPPIPSSVATAWFLRSAEWWPRSRHRTWGHNKARG